jgi:hypothetical protein
VIRLIKRLRKLRVLRLFYKIALCMIEKPSLCIELTLKIIYYYISTYFKKYVEMVTFLYGEHNGPDLALKLLRNFYNISLLEINSAW